MSELVLDEPIYSTDLADDEIEEKAPTVGSVAADEPGRNGVEAILAERMAATTQTERAAVATPPDTVGLKSAVEATYDIAPTGLVPESVIGADQRVRIRSTEHHPWSVHASLLITARDGTRWVGTAFFIGPRVLATAGHNVYFHGPVEARRGWARSIQVTPGRDGDDMPFGSATTSRYATVRGWAVDGPNPDYDYGVIILGEDDRLGAETGTFGLGSYSDTTLRGLTANLSGYPADRGNGEQQWYMPGSIEDVSSHQVFYEIDTFGGQSGSAVYRISGGNRFAFGIHAYGVGRRPHNAATRITRSVYDNLVAWRDNNQ
jgi:V8-like Glu-specific endopeptidase